MKAFPSLYVHFQKVDDLSDPRIIANTHTGMDLRDYFAAKTLNALLSTQEVHSGIAETRVTPDEVAQTAYQWADLMIKAREKK